MSSAKCALYSIQCDIFSELFAVLTIKYVLYSEQCLVLGVHWKVCSVICVKCVAIHEY